MCCHMQLHGWQHIDVVLHTLLRIGRELGPGSQPSANNVPGETQHESVLLIDSAAAAAGRDADIGCRPRPTSIVYLERE